MRPCSPYVEDPYHHMERDSQMRLEAAAVRRRFWTEQQERKKAVTAGGGAKWHISYYSDKDKKRIEAVMKNYGCGCYTLYPQIDQCMKNLC